MFNDLKAPRFSTRRYRKNIIDEKIYIAWKEKYNQILSFIEFKDIWEIIALDITEEILQEKDGIKLPNGLGEIYIGYVPSFTKTIIDYKTSREYNKLIRHENWESRGKLGKIIYGSNGRKYPFKLSGWWGFTACRNFKIAVVHALKTYPERYKNSIEKR